MLSLKFIQENPELVIERLAVKYFDAREIVRQVLALYQKRNEYQIESDGCKAEMNQLSKEIGILFKEGKMDEANKAKADVAVETIVTKEIKANVIDKIAAVDKVIVIDMPAEAEEAKADEANEAKANEANAEADVADELTSE